MDGIGEGIITPLQKPGIRQGPLNSFKRPLTLLNRVRKHCIISVADNWEPWNLGTQGNHITQPNQSHGGQITPYFPEKREVIKSLKRKAAEQPLAVTQNLISEALGDASSGVSD
ncbi:hypothetical protein ACHWQZ_G017942 [Mnemiopsis leidyi]